MMVVLSSAVADSVTIVDISFLPRLLLLPLPLLQGGCRLLLRSSLCVVGLLPLCLPLLQRWSPLRQLEPRRMRLFDHDSGSYGYDYRYFRGDGGACWESSTITDTDGYEKNAGDGLPSPSSHDHWKR